MTLKEYHESKTKYGYREVLTYIVGSEPKLSSFLKYEELDIELKTHLSKVIICRHFSPTGGIALPADIDWFINGFIQEFEGDLVKPWISSAIKESIEMILSGDTFSKQIIAMTFMFGVLEFHAKYRLGYRPESHDFFDDLYHSVYRKMFIGQAINKLKKIKTRLAIDLNQIDKYSIASLKEAGIQEKRHVKARMADRLTFARNTMVHGESHNFYDKGMYLVMIYALFHFHSLKDGTRYEGI